MDTNPASDTSGAGVRGVVMDDEQDYSSYNAGSEVKALGVKIAEILLSSRNFLIFIDHLGNLQWLFKQQPAESAWMYARVAELEARCEFFKELAEKQGGDAGNASETAGWRKMDHARSAKRFIGQGIVILFAGGTRAEAEAAFLNAEKFILQRGREASLGWLYQTFGWLALISIVAPATFLLLGCCCGCWQKCWGELPWTIFLCAAAGGVGAYISRALASRTELPCDANAGKRLHQHEALLRWAVGVAAGGLIGLLIKSRVLLGNLGGDEGGDTLSVTLALALLAGVSERFLPTLLERFDDNLASGDKGGAGTTGDPANAGEVQKAALKKKAVEARKAAEAARLKAARAQDAATAARQTASAADPASKEAAEAAAAKAEADARTLREAAEAAEAEAQKAEDAAQE